MREFVVINVVVCAVIWMVSSLIICLAKHFGKQLSIYKVFGIATLSDLYSSLLWGLVMLVMVGFIFTGIFKFMFTGSLYRKIYRLYEIEG